MELHPAFKEIVKTTYNEPNITCPNCGYVFDNSWEFDEDCGELECDECGANFDYERNTQYSYDSWMDED